MEQSCKLVFFGRTSQVAVVLAFACLSGMAFAGSSEYFDTQNFHPAPVYVQLESVHFAGIGFAVDVREAALHVLNGRTLRPGSGSISPAFSGVGTAQFSINGGVFSPVNFNFTGQSLIQFTGSAGGVDHFDTEMLALNLSGGNLPGGAMIRESPTMPSRGNDTSRPVVGGFMCDSFFDVFVELSVDGGQTWVPGNQPAILRGQGAPEPATFAALGLGLAALIRRRRK